jgi:hypothetical protein
VASALCWGAEVGLLPSSNRLRTGERRQEERVGSTLSALSATLPNSMRSWLTTATKKAMTKSEPESYEGFTIAHATKRFEVVGTELKLSRRWLRSSAFGDKPEFASSIHGRAVADWDHVCVFGTAHRSDEFHFTLHSDLHIAESWESIKGIEHLVDKLDGERLRIRDLQHDVFEKSPPTATLFYHEGHWAMECEVPLPVLDQLSSDLVAGCVDTIRLQIDWPFGFIEKEKGDWGFFDGSQLRGYVSSLTWQLLMPQTPHSV